VDIAFPRRRLKDKIKKVILANMIQNLLSVDFRDPRAEIAVRLRFAIAKN